MKRKLGLFLSITLLAAQTLSLLHMAEYDFEKHSHQGKTCDVYLLYCEYSHSSDIVATPSLQHKPYHVLLESIGTPVFPSSKQKYLAAAPRAPPLVS